MQKIPNQTEQKQWAYKALKERMGSYRLKERTVILRQPTLRSQLTAGLIGATGIADLVHGSKSYRISKHIDSEAFLEWLDQHGLEVDSQLKIYIEDADLAFEFRMRWC